MNKTSETERLYQMTFKLLDEFDRFGHMYDYDGYVKSRYLGIYEDLRDGKLCDNLGCELTMEPFALYNFNCDTLENEDETADYESPGGDNFAYTHRYLNLHNGNSNEFRSMTEQEVSRLTVQDITDKYVNGSILEQLIHMLRRGKNYAGEYPVSEMFGDDYLIEVIAFTWKLILLGEIRARDKANVITFDTFKYDKPKVHNEEPESETFFHCDVKVFMPYAGEYQKSRLERTKKEKDAEYTYDRMMSLVGIGAHERDIQKYDAVINAIRMAVNNS